MHVDRANFMMQYLSIWRFNLEIKHIIATVRTSRSFLWYAMKKLMHVMQSWFWAHGLGVSTGWSGSGLCPTWNRPAHIGWEVERPAADRRQPRVESDRAPVDNGWVGRSQSEFQPPDLRWIFVGNRQIFVKSRWIFTGSSPDLLIFFWIYVTTIGSK